MDLTRRGGNADSLPMFNNDETHPLPSLKAKKDTKTSSRVRFPQIRRKHLMFSVILWILTLFYFERVSVLSTLKKCKWNSQKNGHNDDNDQFHISLIADPQLVDDYSYPGRPRFINYFAKKFTDNYLHRNYIYHKRILDPDAILFLGDLFDGGREWLDEYWFEEYLRFNKVFPKFPDTKVVMSLPGNHDIGFGNDVNITKLNRFRTYFGESNDYFVNGNGFAIVMLDTISLSSNDSLVNAEPLRFLHQLSQPDHEIKKYPTILLTHVPLYRFSDQQHQQCGPLRESSKKFPIMKGKQYQTVLEYELSQQILQLIQPTLIFSGDDHDYCDISHSYIQSGDNKVAREITIKSVAMSAGIKYPAIQLLSLDKDKQYHTDICYMPTPSTSITLYLVLFALQVLSFVVVLLLPNVASILESSFKRAMKTKTDALLPVKNDEKLKLKRQKLDGISVKSVRNLLVNTDWDVPESAKVYDCCFHVVLLSVIVWCLILKVMSRV